MGHSFQSPLRRWEVLAGLCQQLNASTFVEVGCKDGITTAFLLDNLPDLHVIAIDPWAPMPNKAEDYKHFDYQEIERCFWLNVGENKDRCCMRRITSLEAARDPAMPLSWRQEVLREPRFDMVFIDAGHDYENCIADIKAWWPLVREGGIICGHDYQHNFPGVMRAVAEAFPLIRVAVCPDSVWVVHKDAEVRLAA